MEKKIKKDGTLLFLILSFLVISVMGGSYAYFFVGINGGDITNTVESAVLAGVDFGTGQDLEVPAEGIYPGWIGVQTITVNKPDGITEGVGAYQITLDPTVDAGYGDWIGYEVYKTTNAGDTITKVEGTLVITVEGNAYQTDSLIFTGFTEGEIGKVAGNVINSTSDIQVIDQVNYDMSTFVDTTYYIVYYFENIILTQNEAMGKTFSAIVDVSTIEPFEETVVVPVDNAVATLEELVTTNTLEMAVDAHGNIRYFGSNPNNYVDLNNDGTADYRIIGVMNETYDNKYSESVSRLKLVSIDPVSTVFNYDTGINIWSINETSKLDNSTWYDALSTNEKEMIAKSVWDLGGISNTSLNASELYSMERGDLLSNDHNDASTKWSANVGSILGSDYLYATAGGATSSRSVCLTTDLSVFNTLSDCYTNNYLYDNTRVITTMSPSSLNTVDSLMINTNGSGSLVPISTSSYYYRSIFLKESVKIVSGSGTSSSPYVLGL